MVTVNAVRYRDVIKNLTLGDFYDNLFDSRRFCDNLFYLTLGDFYDNVSETVFESLLQMAWFMQHGAPSHTVHDDTIAYVKELYNSRLHSVPYSPDYNPLDFWLWRLGSYKANRVC